MIHVPTEFRTSVKFKGGGFHYENCFGALFSHFSTSMAKPDVMSPGQDSYVLVKFGADWTMYSGVLTTYSVLAKHRHSLCCHKKPVR